MKRRRKFIIVDSFVKKILKKITNKPTPTSSRVTRKRTRMATTIGIADPKKGVVNIIKPTQGKILIKRKTTTEEDVEPSNPSKKPRRKLMVEKDEEEEDVDRVEFDDINQFRVFVFKPPKNIDEVCDNIKGSVGLSSF